jgi:general stress protein YciG
MADRDRQAAGKKGGEAVSRNREHMAAIGRKGGEAVSRNREHMAEIGRKGGAAVSRDREHMATIGRKGGESSQSRSAQDEADANQAASAPNIQTNNAQKPRGRRKGASTSSAQPTQS